MDAFREQHRNKLHTPDEAVRLVKDGDTLSRIVPHFKPCTIVTVPRTMAPNIVTEYGIAQLRGKAMFQRAEALINIAHPDFRDDLIKAATAQKIWTRTNKIV